MITVNTIQGPALHLIGASDADLARLITALHEYVTADPSYADKDAMTDLRDRLLQAQRIRADGAG